MEETLLSAGGASSQPPSAEVSPVLWDVPCIPPDLVQNITRPYLIYLVEMELICDTAKLFNLPVIH